jgi:hypothetical protein
MTALDPANPPTVTELLSRMDAGWTEFGGKMHATPNELLEEKLGAGAWTRKQMLAHITTWHDLTIDRLGRFMDSGEPPDLDEHEDDINARAARAATGRTTGEIVQGVEDSYRRLHRQVARLTDEQLAAHEWWALSIVVGNTFGHYENHTADLEPSPVTSSRSGA